VEPFSLVTILTGAIPLLAAAAGSVAIGVNVTNRCKQQYAYDRQRLSAELITMDEHIGFAEAEGDPARTAHLKQSRLALNTAFQAYNHFYGTGSHKGVPITQAAADVDKHLNNSRLYLAGPAASSNAELFEAAKELGRSVAQIARIGTAKLMASSAQEIQRFATDYQNQRR
jgi:hypothetical protein